MGSVKGPERAAAFVSAAVLAVLSGCMTLTEGAGMLLEGKPLRAAGRYAAAVPPDRVYRVVERAGKAGKPGEAGQGGLEIFIENFPALTIRASPPEGDGTFYLRSLDYLAGTPRGWVEFSLELSGEGEFIPAEGGAGLRLKSRPSPLGILGGRIRLDDTRLSGDGALRVLKDRRERIRALSGWMREQELPVSGDFRDFRDFQAYWKPLLLPELVPEAERPGAYGGGPRVKAERVKWDTAYTMALLPEELRPLRDSGALKRDWEECGEWIFLEYAWENVFADLESGVRLLKK
jgi:hypothetical protein